MSSAPDLLDRTAQIGGLSLSELNSLELQFLFALDFNLALSPDHYARRVRLLLLRSPSAAADYCLQCARARAAAAELTTAAGCTATAAGTATVAAVARTAGDAGAAKSPSADCCAWRRSAVAIAPWCRSTVAISFCVDPEAGAAPQDGEAPPGGVRRARPCCRVA